ncbi:MAG: Hsp20/alpha crystallin family protein [Smithellaceae bacterium]|jgi:HSP20 family protein|nr:Hsp20/alpha crystallin family protein [Smithellaceae bacterium]
MFTPGIWRFRRLSDTMPEMLNLQREMNRLFSNMGQKSPQEYPAVNIWEKGGSAVITAELPGIDPEKLDISVSGDTVTISGEALRETLAEGEIYLRQERGIGNFKRNIQLPFQINAQEVEARYEKGILVIVLPRVKEDLPKKIKIQ